MFNVGDLVLTKECSDVRASRGKIVSLYSKGIPHFEQFINTKRYSVQMIWGEVLSYWEDELELNPQTELFDMTCESVDIY